MRNNKYLGNKFEKELSEILYDAGYWVHLLNQNKNGQPADIIAVKCTFAYLIDAKECTRGIFDVSRVEYNQELSMDMWLECGNNLPYFALKAEDEIYMISWQTIKDLRAKGKKRLNIEDMKKYGMRLTTWLSIKGA